MVKLFDKIKTLFGKKTEAEVVEEKAEEEVDGIDSGAKCYGCQRSIFDTQKTKSFDGKQFHIMCYRTLIKEGTKEVKENLGL